MGASRRLCASSWSRCAAGSARDATQPRPPGSSTMLARVPLLLAALASAPRHPGVIGSGSAGAAAESKRPVARVDAAPDAAEGARGSWAPLSARLEFAPGTSPPVPSASPHLPSDLAAIALTSRLIALNRGGDRAPRAQRRAETAGAHAGPEPDAIPNIVPDDVPNGAPDGCPAVAAAAIAVAAHDVRQLRRRVEHVRPLPASAAL
jgi:hypothetical protein